MTPLAELTTQQIDYLVHVFLATGLGLYVLIACVTWSAEVLAVLIRRRLFNRPSGKLAQEDYAYQRLVLGVDYDCPRCGRDVWIRHDYCGHCGCRWDQKGGDDEPSA